MAVDKLVDSTQLDSDLTDVADEIRTAGGTLLPLSFPDDYVVAIGDIGNTEIKTASGSIAHFEDALARKAQDLTVAIEPVQSGSGDPSPDNVRPISGWTGAKVTRTGVNVWDEETESGAISASSGNPATNADFSRSKNFCPIKPGLTYFRGAGMVNDCALFFYRKDKSYIGVRYLGTTQAFDAPADAYFFKLHFRGTTYNHDISINYPSTDHDYHAYAGDTYSITFPSEAGTVYGGTLDVTTGKLTVDRAIYDFGAGVVGPVNVSEDARSQGLFSAYGFTPPVARVSDISAVTAPDGIICNQFVAAPNNAFLSPGRSPAEPSFSQYATSFYVQWSVLAGKTNAEAKTLLTGVQISAPLATPIVYDLTPTEVTTLLGTNNVWADTGDSTIQYIAPKAQIPSAQGVYF